MKLLVLSDSHRETEHMLLAIRKERPDAVVHLGDHAADADAIAQECPYLPLYRVRGNCDYYDDVTPEQALLHFGGVRFLAVHGHRYGVKTGLLRLCYAAREKEAQVALFGHTHRALCAREEGLWLLNPGACGGRASSYGIVELENGAVKCCVKELYLEE